MILLVTTIATKRQNGKSVIRAKSKLVDSATYDITAWSIPYSYGVNAWAVKENLQFNSYAMIQKLITN